MNIVRCYKAKLALGFALAFFGMVLPLLPLPLAGAQVPRLFDLNGVWELEDRGELAEPKPDRVLVRITHAGSTLRGELLSGAECFDGKVRPRVFLHGELSIPIPGRAVSFVGVNNRIWACSGSAILVQQCGGSISSMYETTFKNGTVEQNLITADRVLQGVRDCQLDPASNGTFRFTLRRVPPCDDAERKVAEREEALRSILNPILDARGIFGAAVAAAERRYADTYKGQPTRTLAYPYLVMATKWEFDSAATERFFELLPQAIASDQWMGARAMVADMALLADPPLPEALTMLEKIYGFDEVASRGTRALDSLKKARQDLEACRWAHSPAR